MRAARDPGRHGALPPGSVRQYTVGLMRILHRLARYLPLLFGTAGLVLFTGYGLATGRLLDLAVLPLAGITIALVLIASNLLYLAPEQLRERLALGLLGVYTAGILFMGLRPRAGRSYLRWHHNELLALSGTSTYDVVMNIVGFMPLGFLLVVWLAESGRVREALRSLVFSTLACGLLSLAIETTQYLIAGRASSLVDVAMNALGALLGATYAVLYVRLWRNRLETV